MGYRQLGLGRGVALLLCGGVLVSACSGAGSEESNEAVSEPIIAGVPANGAKLNAIGSIGYVVEYEGASYFEPYCSGSLIGKQTVLTAKHCLQFFEQDYQYGLKTAFAVGPDAFAPVRVVEVVDVSRAPVDQGGFIGFGHDVGVMYLGEKVTDLTPLKLGSLKKSDLGKKFVEIGYGVRDNSGAYGTRRTGNATLRATTGKVFEIIFGSFERFKSWYETGSPETQALFRTGPVAPAAFLPLARSLYEERGPADGAGGSAGVAGSAAAGSPAEAGAPSVGGAGPEPDFDELLRYYYDSVVLTDGYEAVFGGAKGDAQACYGDSGSPVVRADSSGALVAYGVISGGLGSNQLVCDYGGVDATFGPGVLDFLEASKKWVDPCKGVSVAGECAKNVAKRCTSPLEGPRRLVKFDCRELGQVCAVQPDGTAGCSDP